MHKLYIPILVWLLTASSASAAGFEVEFGPFVGNGDSSDDSSVRYVSGFRASLSKSIYENSRLRLSPLLSFENSFFNTRTVVQDEVTIADYDHRTFGLGLEIATPAKLSGRPFDIFARASTARSFTKV